MILRRLGNKKKLAAKIQSYFPKHVIYFEPFFGAGGMFFHKPLAKYNYVNDNDSEVYNFFKVIRDETKAFERALSLTPLHVDQLNYWKENNETDPVLRAVRFLFLSNYTYLGVVGSLRFCVSNSKQIALQLLQASIEKLQFVKFNNCDFEKFLKAFTHREERDVRGTFVYCDPPYLGTTDNYANGFTEEDSLRLFDALEKKDWKFAISEFNHPFILQQAEERGLNIITIGDRISLNKRSTEILITNYAVNQTKLF